MTGLIVTILGILALFIVVPPLVIILNKYIDWLMRILK